MYCLPDTWTGINTFQKQEGQQLNVKKDLNKKQWHKIQWYTFEIRITKPIVKNQIYDVSRENKKSFSSLIFV